MNNALLYENHVSGLKTTISFIKNLIGILVCFLLLTRCLGQSDGEQLGEIHDSCGEFLLQLEFLLQSFSPASISSFSFFTL